MKLLRHILFLILIINFLSGCDPILSDRNSANLIINHFKHNKINSKDSHILDRITEDNVIKYIYRTNKDTSEYSFTMSCTNDSFINIYGLECPLVSKKNIYLNGQNYIINKYCYDVINGYDEESSFYYNENYGLLLGFNNGWLMLMFTMEYDNISKILVDSVLNDSTGFYRLSIPPPPKPIDNKDFNDLN